jgi:hypothetical protein
MHTERRQVPRLTFTHQLFRLGSTGKVFGVADLSTGGMSLRLIDPNDLLHFTVGREIEGQLQLWRPAKWPVKARVVSIRGELVGLEFKALASETSRTLSKFLDPALRAATMKRMPVSNDRLHWYHGEGGLDLYVWFSERDSSHASRFCLMTGVASGAVVIGEGASPSSIVLRTGKTGDASAAPIQHGVVQDETQGLKLDVEPDAEKLGIAKSVILSSNMTESLKKELTSWIETLHSNLSE